MPSRGSVSPHTIHEKIPTSHGRLSGELRRNTVLVHHYARRMKTPLSHHSPIGPVGEDLFCHTTLSSNCLHSVPLRTQVVLKTKVLSLRPRNRQGSLDTLTC